MGPPLLRLFKMVGILSGHSALSGFRGGKKKESELRGHHYGFNGHSTRYRLQSGGSPSLKRTTVTFLFCLVCSFATLCPLRLHESEFFGSLRWLNPLLACRSWILMAHVEEIRDPEEVLSVIIMEISCLLLLNSMADLKNPCFSEWEIDSILRKGLFCSSVLLPIRSILPKVVQCSLLFLFRAKKHFLQLIGSAQ